MVVWGREEGGLEGRVERMERLRWVGGGLRERGRMRRGWRALAGWFGKLRKVGMEAGGLRRQRRVGGRRRKLWRCVGVIATKLLKAFTMHTLRRACD